MSKRTSFIIAGVCTVVTGLGIGLVLFLQHNDTIKPVANHMASSPSSETNLIVGNSSPSDGFQQAGTNQSNPPGTSGTSNAATSNASKLLDPSTFSQYDTSKYKNGTSAYFADLQVGTGAMLSQPGQKAVILYKGWLTNGTLFDETKVNAEGQNEAFSFEFGANPPQVIPGFTEGLSGMKVGGVRFLIIPPAAGYGATAHGPIPANSLLIFQVQLAEIQ